MTVRTSPTEPEQLRELLSGDARRIAPQLLGSVLSHNSHEGTVAVRITEVEAYMGPGESLHPDPGSHTFRGPTARNAPMFGPAGHLYVYFTYGMHYCANVVCGPAGTASAVLLRAGEVVEGQRLAAVRRPTSKSPFDLASGPARLATSLGITTGPAGHCPCPHYGGQRAGCTERTLRAAASGNCCDGGQFRASGGRFRGRRHR